MENTETFDKLAEAIQGCKYCEEGGSMIQVFIIAKEAGETNAMALALAKQNHYQRYNENGGISDALIETHEIG